LTFFVDTSIWYSAADRRDASNQRAKEILEADEPVLTTDHVLVETWLLLARRLGRDAAERFWEGIRGGGARVEGVGEADLDHAWTIGQAWPDQNFSLIDRTSFAVMLRLGLDRAASLDDHFAVFRYGPGRRRAFEVLR
jgi:predicted nucleic acid-binding protein